MTSRPYRAGEAIEDYCRACRIDRQHTVVACDASGVPVRVVCSFCRSEHNYRGGPRMDPPAGGHPVTTMRSTPTAADADRPRSARPTTATRGPSTSRGPFETVTERERSYPAMSTESGSVDLETLLRRVIREEAGVSAVVPADKWRGGHLVLRPGTPGLQEKSWPIETFFHKVVMLRNRLRTLEQHLNASELPEDAKVKLQTYVTGCYGSLTSFNILFSEEEDQFKGTGE